MTDVDTRSYFPEFKRTIQLPDGREYFIRDLQDLPIGAFQRIVADEEKFTTISIFERIEIEKQHMQLLLVAPVTTRGSAPKGENALRLDGAGELGLDPGDVVYVSGGLYLERNNVLSLTDDRRTAIVEYQWRFDSANGARVFRAVPLAVLDMLTFGEFARVTSDAKGASAGAKEDGESVPQKAASEATS